MKCDQRTKNDKVVDDTSNEETIKVLADKEERRQRNSPQLQNAYCTSHLKSHHIKKVKTVK